MNIVVLISGNGSNLQAIIDAIKNNQLNATIQAVMSNNTNAYGLTRAQNADIATHIIDNDNLVLELNRYQPDLVVLAGYMKILKPDVIAHYKNRIINIHPSLLPKHPGLHTHQRVLDSNDRTHGVSIHFVSDVLDGGPLLAQAAFKVFHNDTVASLQKRAHEIEHQMYPQVLQRISSCYLKQNDGKIEAIGGISHG